MIHLVLGKQGSGKTLLLVKLAWDLYKKGNINIHSNICFKFPFNPLDYHKIVGCELPQSTIFIDEIHQLLPSRRAMRAVNVAICDGFLSMARKQEVDIWATTQSLRKPDIRFVEECDMIYQCVKYAFINNRWIKVMANIKIPKEIPILIEVTREDTETHDIRKVRFIGNPYYELYDTRQIIKIENMPSLKEQAKGTM